MASTEAIIVQRRTASYERLTAADRPGVAQPVPERPVPVKPWGAMMLAVVVLVVLATAIWEWRMRSLELAAGDLRDGPSFWAEQRRRLDAGDVQVAIVGDSRILFDTDLDRFQALTGVRPVQLALPGTNGLPFLENVAADPDFKGLLVVGLADMSYFRREIGLMADALDRYEYESPAQRSSFVLHRAVSRELAFLDENYRLSRLVQRLDHGARAGTAGPYDSPWKVATTGEDRQTALWRRIETDRYLNGHARHFWARGNQRPPVDDGLIAEILERSIKSVAQLRAHGGEIAYVRPPSAGFYVELEQRVIARERGWEPLLAATNAPGIHGSDDPVTRSLYLPEISHASRACSTVYTDAYVRSLVKVTRLRLLPDAPPPLTPADCAPTGDYIPM